MSRYTAIDVRDVPRWDSEADVVVVGLGASGVCAAIEARSLGADVLVLERASGGGGITMNAAGHLYLGGGTRVQKAVGVEDSVDDMERYLLAVTPAPDEEKIHLYCEQSVAHFDWLVAQGVPFNDTMYKGKHVLQMTDECLIWSGNEEVWPYREQAKPAPRGHKVAQVGELGGAKMMEQLIARSRQLGVRVTVDAHVHGLVRDGDRIVGVRYAVFGEERAARATRGDPGHGAFHRQRGDAEAVLPEARRPAHDAADDALRRWLRHRARTRRRRSGRSHGGRARHLPLLSAREPDQGHPREPAREALRRRGLLPLPHQHHHE